MNDDNNIISLSSLFESDTEKSDNDIEKDFEMIEIEDEPPKDDNEVINLGDVIKQDLFLKESNKKRDYDKIIEKVQIGLIVFLVVAGTLIYFFGYDFFEPYIKID